MIILQNTVRNPRNRRRTDGTGQRQIKSKPEIAKTSLRPKNWRRQYLENQLTEVPVPIERIWEDCRGTFTA